MKISVLGFPANESFVDGSIASVQFLPEGTHDFLYIVKTPCASIRPFYLVMYGPSSAGNDGSDTICMNKPSTYCHLFPEQLIWEDNGLIQRGQH